MQYLKALTLFLVFSSVLHAQDTPDPLLDKDPIAQKNGLMIYMIP